MMKVCASTGCEKDCGDNPSAKWCAFHRDLKTRQCCDCGGVIKVHSKGAVRCPACGDSWRASRSTRAYLRRLVTEVRKQREVAKRLSAQPSARRAAAMKKQRDAAHGKVRRTAEHSWAGFAYGTCQVCGDKFLAYYSYELPTVCSDTCRRSKGRKSRRGVVYPHWSKVAQAQGSMDCWICGERCNSKDYTSIDGVFIAGPTYPSSDHLDTVQDGGEHSLSNLRIAHMLCNSLRGTTHAAYFYAGSGAS